jgi:hypothetical protein
MRKPTIVSTLAVSILIAAGSASAAPARLDLPDIPNISYKEFESYLYDNCVGDGVPLSKYVSADDPQRLAGSILIDRGVSFNDLDRYSYFPTSLAVLTSDISSSQFPTCETIFKLQASAEGEFATLFKATGDASGIYRIEVRLIASIGTAPVQENNENLSPWRSARTSAQIYRNILPYPDRPLYGVDHISIYLLTVERGVILNVKGGAGIPVFGVKAGASGSGTGKLSRLIVTGTVTPLHPMNYPKPTN